jgi:hypothetical protein
MEFTHYSSMRQWLYVRRHSIWFGYIEPVISVIAVGWSSRACSYLKLSRSSAFLCSFI